MPPVLLALALAALIGAAAVMRSPKTLTGVVKLPDRAPAVPEVVEPEGNHDPMRVFGVTWKPLYIKSLGCKDFRWGVCAKRWAQDLTKGNALKTYDSVITWIANAAAAGAGTVAKWITDNMCMRFKFPLRAYEDEYGRGYAIHRKTGHIGAPATHPLPPKDGWKRAWVLTEPGTNVARSDNVWTIHWPDSEVPGGYTAEIGDQDTIRGLLRMDDKYPGALRPGQLAKAACGKSRRWLARASKANEEYK